MNNNFEFDQGPQNEILMSPEEKRSHKKLFSRLCLSFLLYIVITEVLGVAVTLACMEYAPELLNSGNFTLILNAVLQYAIAFPCLALILKKIPKQAPKKESLKGGTFLKYALVSMFVMYVGNYISMLIMSYVELYLGEAPENTVNTVLENSNFILSALVVGIIGPIVEELMFRKFFIDRLTPYGEAVAIFFPSLIFGLFHGNLYQFFYAFFLGAAFSYIYVKTGKIIYSSALHIFINLFCGVLPSYILSMFDYEEFLELALTGAGSLTEEYIQANALPLMLLLAYEIIMIGMVLGGILTLLRNIKNIRLNKGEVRFPKGEGADIMFFNAGTVALIAICLITVALNTFAV